MIGGPGPRLLVGSTVALALGIALSALAGLPLLPGYLLAWLFLAAIPLGALPLLMIQAITGGRWIEAAGPPLRAALGTLPLLAVAFIPILIFQRQIYPWAGSGPPVGHALESGWLSPGFFTLRSVVYLAAWLVLARLLAVPSGEAGPARRGFAAPGLILHALLVTFAAVDWSMSLEPDWHSTGYGMLIIAKQLAIGLAFACVWAGRAGADPAHCRDLGAMLLAAVIVWLYVVFMSFLVSWSADLPHEVAWYQRRGGGWLALLAIAILLHFMVPFFVLISSRAKRRPRVLATIGALVLIGAVADYAWLILPAFRRDGFSLSIQDALAAVTLAGPWLWLLTRRDRRPATVEAAHGHA